jgi:putrescine aminotransferase
VLAEVRGCGLLLALEFHEDHFAGDFVLELVNRQVIVSTSLNTHRVVRLHPAAIMDEDDIEWLLRALRESAEAVEERFGGGSGA